MILRTHMYKTANAVYITPLNLNQSSWADVVFILFCIIVASWTTTNNKYDNAMYGADLVPIPAIHLRNYNYLLTRRNLI